jgi:hypothetical protein
MVSGFSTHFQGVLMVSGVRLLLGAESIYGLRNFNCVSNSKFIVTNIVDKIDTNIDTIYGHNLVTILKIIVTYVIFHRNQGRHTMATNCLSYYGLENKNHNNIIHSITFSYTHLFPYTYHSL